ncbi:MAG: hypothetical protein ACKO3K_20635 [Cuspidothrix sp.]
MNTIENILQYADNVIFETTGESLTPVQEAILKGAWEGKKYWEIAESFNNCSESHIKKEAANLWKKLGEALGENLNKKNFRSKLEKNKSFIEFHSSSYCLLQNNQNTINIGSQFIQTTNNRQKTSNSPKPQNQTPKIDLTKAPELNYNYGRTSEIATLKQWILENKTRLITISGLNDIGKTALTLKLISEIKTEFDYIIYRSFDNLPKLITLKNDLQQFLSQSQNPLPQILDYLKS